MKKTIVALLFLPLVSFAAFDVNLKPGARGDAVFEAQDILHDSGCLLVSPTGYWGVLSVKATKCFQAKNLLPATGYWGPMTRTVAKSIASTALEGIGGAEFDETGTTTPPSQEAFLKQIDELNRKFNEEVQRKLATEAQAKAAQDALKAQVDAVVTNTTPAPVAPPPAPIPDACPMVAGHQTETPCADTLCIDAGGQWISGCAMPIPGPVVTKVGGGFTISYSRDFYLDEVYVNVTNMSSWSGSGLPVVLQHSTDSVCHGSPTNLPTRLVCQKGVHSPGTSLVFSITAQAKDDDRFTGKLINISVTKVVVYDAVTGKEFALNLEPLVHSIQF